MTAETAATTTATWRVDAERQAAFVALSGDRNPFHTDPIAARRLPFGRVAVHGLHLLLDTLDRIAGELVGTPRRIRCTFRHPVGVGDELTTAIDTSDPAHVTANVTVDVWTAADIRVELGAPLGGGGAAPALPPLTEPEVHTIDGLVGHAGTIPVAIDGPIARRRFPRLTDRLGIGRVAELVSLTRLVGMHVPGEHSLLSALDVALDDHPDGRAGASGGIDHTVTTADERFSRVVIAVSGPTLHGTLTTFVRAEPVDQSLGDVGPEPDEFAGQRWLVVGGSRGLGAAAVQLLVAGGADVRFTYRSGADDAAEIGRRTGAAPFRLDVDDPDSALAAIVADGWRPTHLAYMATPPIFDGVGGSFSDTLHRRFLAIYVDAFRRLVDRLVDRRDDRRDDDLAGVLWPSSEAVVHDVAGMAEYADAKRAGEQACHDLADAHPGLTVFAPRLPRLLTDQTTSFVPTEFGDTATEMLAALRGVTG